VEIERPQLERADLGEIAANLYGKLLSEILARDRAGRDAHDGLTRGRAAAPAVVTNAVLLLIRVVGVAGAEAVLDLRVVAAFLIDVLDEQADRRSRRATLEDAGEDLHLIRLLPLRNIARAAGPASTEILLDVGFGQRETGRTAVDDAAHRGPMAFAERRDREQSSVSIACHLSCSPRAAGPLCPLRSRRCAHDARLARAKEFPDLGRSRHQHAVAAALELERN